MDDFLCELLRRYPEIEVDCLDASKRMLQLARRRIEQELPASLKRVRFIHTDIRSWVAPEHQYDLVVTAFLSRLFSRADSDRRSQNSSTRRRQGRNLVGV
jgi:ubiquinone/menaquinone biosynthesis C-methylase UbiE